MRSSAVVERVQLLQLGPRTGGLEQLVLLVVEHRSGLGLVIARRLAQTSGDVSDHNLDTILEELGLPLGVAQLTSSPGRVSHVMHVLAHDVQTDLRRSTTGKLLGCELCQRSGRSTLELLREVAQQALADKLQQHRVVALEGRVDVEILVPGAEPVLAHVASAATGLASLLQRVEPMPCRQRLQTGGERLEILAALRRVFRTREDTVELAAAAPRANSSSHRSSRDA